MKLGKEADEVTEETQDVAAIFESEWTPVTSRRNRFNRNLGEIGWIGHEQSDEIMNVESTKGKEKIRVQIDSGAVDTVGPKEIGRAFKLRETRASKLGRNYVAANGTTIRNYGERLVKGESESGIRVTMPVQIADVKRVLMSVHKMNQAGLIVILDGRDSYFQERVTGKKDEIEV